MEAHRKVRDGEIAVRNPDTQGTMVVPVKSFEDYWRGRGWLPLGETSIDEAIKADGYQSATEAVEDLGEEEVGKELLEAAEAEGYEKKAKKSSKK